jgi:hypothetical protein
MIGQIISVNCIESEPDAGSFHYRAPVKIEIYSHQIVGYNKKTNELLTTSTTKIFIKPEQWETIKNIISGVI